MYASAGKTQSVIEGAAMVQDPSAWGGVTGLLVDAVRYLAWWFVGGLIGMSAGWYGGVVALDAYHEWQKSGPPPRSSRRRDEVAREAQRGLRQIESFLADLEERHGSGG
jgi:hypothetical protein